MEDKKKQGTVENILILFLKSLGVRFNPSTIRKSVLEHPDYPSILSITDCLHTLKIPNRVFQAEANSETIAQLTFPLIVQTNKKNNNLLVLEYKKDEQLYYRKGADIASMTEQEFIKIWTGVLLYAEPDTNSGEGQYWVNYFKNIGSILRIPFIISVVLIGFILGLSKVTSPWIIAIAAIKLVGLGISILLLIQSINSKNPFVKSICDFGKKSNCESVLNSKAANLTFFLSWSEVGFFYFSGTILTLLLAEKSILLLFYMSLGSVLFSFYSISYQVKNNTYCTLCLITQFTIWIEAIAFFLAQNYDPKLNFGFEWLSVGQLLLCFLVPIAIWAYLKPVFLNAEQTGPLRKALHKFKYNSEIFTDLLIKGEQVTISDNLMPILLGNPDSQQVLTVVSSPFCNPCAKAHSEIDKLLEVTDDLLVKIIFIPFPDENRAKVSFHLASLSKTEDQSVAAAALKFWYGSKQKKYELLQERYPLVLDQKAKVELLQKQNEWAWNAQISSTPTIFLNGYRLPEPYEVKDLKFLL